MPGKTGANFLTGKKGNVVPESSLHALIIGGGLGGLCLAQGLRKAGLSVAVYERDATPESRRQGYRIHIDSQGANALRACLPAHLFELFTATTSSPGHRITILSKRLKTVKVIGPAKSDTASPAPFTAGVDRLTLREILLAGLDGSVSFGKEFSHYEQQADGSVQAFFTDGTAAWGDVLVGADGISSRVRQQLLPEVAPADTGARCIYGKVLLTEATRPLLPEALSHGFTVVVGSHISLALGLVEFLHQPAEAASQLAPEIQFSTTGSYLMWSLNATRGRFTDSDDELLCMDGMALLQLALKQIKSWHSHLHTLLTSSDPAEIFPIAVRASMPCDPWPGMPITLLGDAIHAMSPAGGSGANMALRDASLLCQALLSTVHGEKDLASALHGYEERMLLEGFEAVRFSARGGALNTGTSQKRSLLKTLLHARRHT